MWEKAAEITMEHLTRYGCYEESDFFEMMYSGMQAKLHIMKQYPYIGAFTIKAFYEKDAAVGMEIQKSYQKYVNLKARRTLQQLDPKQFMPGLDLKMMYREMYLASEGYLWEMVHQGNVDVAKMEQDFTAMIEFWKKIYLRKEG